MDASALPPSLHYYLDTFTSSAAYKPLLLTSAVVGLLYFSSHVFSFVRLIFSLFILPGKSLKSFGTPNESWALVTGPTDGLGWHFAQKLAKANYNLLLASRSKDKLGNLSDQLSSDYPSLSIKTCAIDFSAASAADYARLKALVDEVGDVGILINNVGKSHSIPVTYMEDPEEEIHDIVEINIIATTKLTSMVVPGMVSRKRGLILTMGSFGGLIPTPLLATYSGSKAFLQQWSSALGSELAPHGVTVEVVLSYLITGAMSKVRRSSVMVPTPKEFVASTLSRIGRSGGAQGMAYTCTPWWSHAILHWALQRFVGLSGRLVVGQNRGMHEGVRQRALRKQAREAEKGKKGQ